MSLEDKLKELRDKYREFLREGKTEEATEVYLEAERLKNDEQPSEESSADYEQFEEIDGVGEEIAFELAEDFDSVGELSEASPEDLEPIPGIGEKRAKSIIEQAAGE